MQIVSDADSLGAGEFSGHRPQPRRATRLPEIDPARCTACGRCVAVCRPRVLSLEVAEWKKFAVLHDRDHCTGCTECAVACPFRAITMRSIAPAPASDAGNGLDT